MKAEFFLTKSYKAKKVKIIISETKLSFLKRDIKNKQKAESIK